MGVDAGEQSLPIEVTMLGYFAVRRGDRAVTEDDGRTKKVWILMEYLLANRHSDISQDKLIEVLWEDVEKCDDPYHALKNLVYRARKMLSSLSDDKTEYIKFVRNTYRWNNDIPCTVDVEEFERYWSEASDKEKSIDERISLYEKALSIYGGEFLPKSSYVNWVIAKSSYYTSIYNECVLRVCSLLADTKRFEEMVGVCEKAVVIAPFEEQIHKWLIYAYINCKKSSKAMAHYEYVLDLFQRELNVDLSDSLRNLHREIVNGVNAVETDLSVIKQDLQEVCETNGAFYCDYEVFKNIYRVLARSMLRTGQSIHVGLITLTDANGDMPDERDIKKAKEQLRDCVVFSLRKGDAVASYSASQFIITLPLTTFENGQMVLERIVNRFRSVNKNPNIRVSTRLNNVDPT